MPEPTIDDLLKWLERIDYAYVPETDSPEYVAIRAILEQQKFQDEQMQAWYRGKENEVLLFRGKVEREAIRAFVDKASKHVEPLIGQPNYYGQFYIAIKEFLDEMETGDVEST